MKNIYILLLFIFCSCSETTKDKSIAAPKQNITAQKLLDLAIEASGTNYLYNAEVSFQYKDVTYTTRRNGYQYKFDMQRENDTIKYYAVSTNGNFDYTENGIQKSYGGKNVLLEKQLIFLNSFVAIPAIFKNDNSIEIELIPQTNIKGIDYRVLQINYKSHLPSELLDNIRIYINPQTLLVDYVSYALMPATDRLILRELYNRRSIEGIQFADYKTYYSKTKVSSHNDMISLFNTNGLLKQESFNLKNVKVTTEK